MPAFYRLIYKFFRSEATLHVPLRQKSKQCSMNIVHSLLMLLKIFRFKSLEPGDLFEEFFNEESSF